MTLFGIGMKTQTEFENRNTAMSKKKKKSSNYDVRLIVPFFT